MPTRYKIFALLVIAVAAGAMLYVSVDRYTAQAERPAAQGAMQGYDALVAGGGGLPEANQVSIEQDLAMASKLFGADDVYFAGGADAKAVQVLDPEASQSEPDRLRRDLGFIFAPSAGRGTTYRKTRLEGVRGPASRDALLEALRQRVKGPTDDALLVYFAGHGDVGATAADNIISTWGNETLSVREVAEVLDQAQRPVVTVLTTCFSGGFQELIFEGAEISNGVTQRDRCGLFASTWDQEAGGCDPNPVRGEQDGFGVHFLHALEGTAPNGDALDRAALDVDGDGALSLLEAHAYARIASKSIDVPTTTSEAYLRVVATGGADSTAGLLPEDERVIAALGARLSAASFEAAKSGLEARDRELDALAEVESAAVNEEDAAYRRVTMALLARWPVLNDPWHPHFDELFAAESQAIRAFLDTSPEHQAFLDATRVTRKAADERAEAQAKRAPWQRLVRAHENVRLAAALHEKGGAEWARFQKFRACERLNP